MRAHLAKRLREIDDTGGPAKRLDAMARTARNLLGLNRAIDLEAIAAHLREMEPILVKAEADTRLLDRADKLWKGADEGQPVVLDTYDGESFREILERSVEETEAEPARTGWTETPLAIPATETTE